MQPQLLASPEAPFVEDEQTSEASFGQRPLRKVNPRRGCGAVSPPRTKLKARFSTLPAAPGGCSRGTIAVQKEDLHLRRGLGDLLARFARVNRFIFAKIRFTLRSFLTGADLSQGEPIAVARCGSSNFVCEGLGGWVEVHGQKKVFRDRNADRLLRVVAGGLFAALVSPTGR